MATELLVQPQSLAFSELTEVEGGKTYLAVFDGRLELAVGFELGPRRPPDNSNRHSGLLFLTGDAALKATLFVPESGFWSDVAPVLAAPTGHDASDLSYILEEAAQEGSVVAPTAQLVGYVDHYNTLAVMVKAGDATRGLRPLLVDLKECRAIASDFGYLHSFQLKRVIHPVLPVAPE